MIRIRALSNQSLLFSIKQSINRPTLIYKALNPIYRHFTALKRSKDEPADAAKASMKWQWRGRTSLWEKTPGRPRLWWAAWWSPALYRPLFSSRQPLYSACVPSQKKFLHNHDWNLTLQTVLLLCRNCILMWIGDIIMCSLFCDWPTQNQCDQKKE